MPPDHGRSAGRAVGFELYLVRHGIAEERRPGRPDAARALTTKGVASLLRVRAGLRALGVEFDLVITSPLRRARETAEVLVGGKRRDGGRARSKAARIVVSDALVPSGPADAAVAAIAAHARAGARIAVVGHEPALGALAAHLLGAAAPIPFKKGGVCRIDFAVPPPAGTASLRWFATPKLLRLHV